MLLLLLSGSKVYRQTLAKSKGYYFYYHCNKVKLSLGHCMLSPGDAETWAGQRGALMSMVSYSRAPDNLEQAFILLTFLQVCLELVAVINQLLFSTSSTLQSLTGRVLALACSSVRTWVGSVGAVLHFPQGSSKYLCWCLIELSGFQCDVLSSAAFGRAMDDSSGSPGPALMSVPCSVPETASCEATAVRTIPSFS